MPVYPFPQISSILKHSLRPKTEISLDKPSSMIPTHHKNWESHATPLEADWMESEWFGIFIPYTDNWIFHIEMGWLYINEFNPESMWIWSEEKGWIWTTQSLLPFFTQTTQATGYTYCPENLREKNSTTTRPKLSSNFTIPGLYYLGVRIILASKSPN